LQNKKEVNTLTDHLFRNEYGKMVASLTRIFGIGQMSIAEDIVQDTMVLALKEWSFKPIPPNPTAWLYVVAKNKAIDFIRREKNKLKITSDIAYLLESEYTLSSTVNTIFSEPEIKDSQLRMMFALCHPAISIEAQITLILKTLCGFGNEEVAKALLTNIETINKRLYRSKEKLRKENIKLEVPSSKKLLPRLDAVLKSIYLLFNEGYNTSSGKDQVISKDLCLEAMRLCVLLTEKDLTNTPTVNALLALMCFNASRFNSRISTEGDIILYKEQDRKLWDKGLIVQGTYYLGESAIGNSPSSYHLEAAIASYYCQSPSFDETDWHSIYSLYLHLVKINPSPMVKLNMSIVKAYCGNIDNAIEDVLALESLKKNHLYYAVLGDLYRQKKNLVKAKENFEAAKLYTKNPRQLKLITKKLQTLEK
jgi:RNA polymerase sigma-70 factor (ECF subfamily)